MKISNIRISVLMCTCILGSVLAVPSPSDPNAEESDGKLSLILLSRPAPTADFSEIVVYRTDKPNWIETAALSALVPIARLTDPSDIARFFDVLGSGRMSQQKQNEIALSYRDITFPKTTYHILAYDSARARYGYLRVRINTGRDPGTVAEVRPLCDADPVEYYRGLPEFLHQLK